MTELDLSNSNIVQETDLSKKLTIDGQTKAYQVYRIKLDQLYYNDQNDRIATWMSKYESENGAIDINNPEYNNIIHDMIKESNLDAFKKTKNNIKLYEQRESGVVLRDGRIIDGNRRFTCLRELSLEDPKFSFFDAVILDNTYDDETGKKAIKSLELTLQHGTEKQVDYDPINKLVGIYRDLIEDGHSFEPKEYARCIDQKEAEVRKLMEIANLMVDFLEFVNAPKQFYIASNLNINGPLYEIHSVLKKLPDDEVKERYKKDMFASLLFGSGDMTRQIRKFKKIAESELSEEYLTATQEIVDEVIEKIASIDEPITQTVISEQIRNDEELARKIEETVNSEFDRISIMNAKDAPLNLVDNAMMKISAIDKPSIEIVEQKDDLRYKLEELKKMVEERLGMLNDQTR
ncbi:hypothetical protein PED39_02500 [Methanomassiliicoccales archaeon LGM-RCC1]|nr:hypothetical protein PED39_02500 [Methanomassiliicoccales archaeon LGM-RCC1]